MPARQFFAVLRGAKKKQSERTSWLLYEATFIAACAQMDGKGIERVQQGYREGFAGEVKTKIMSSDIAAQVLNRMLGGNNILDGGKING